MADFEGAVADLEGAEAARAFGSGMGAVTAVVLGLCSPGDHIVASRQLYAGTQLVFQAMCPRFGIDVTFVDGTEPGAMAAAVRPGKTMLVWAETPANPRLDLVDLDELGAIAGPMTVVDSTFATPLGQSPLAPRRRHRGPPRHQGDGRPQRRHPRRGRRPSAELVQWLTGFAVLQGAVASPYDAANGAARPPHPAGALRPPVRDGAGAGPVAGEGRPGRRRPPPRPRVAPPARPGPAPDAGTAAAWSASTCPAASRPARRFVESVEIAQLASSLGGPETLVTHPASTTHVNLLPEELAEVGIGPGTIRMSVGLEHVDDLRADLDRALAAAGAVGDAASS